MNCGRNASEFVEDKERSGDEAEAGYRMVPAQVRSKVIRREDAKDRERHDLLDDFELYWREAAVADAIGRDLKAILEEGDRPTDDDHLPERLALVLKVAIPGNGHEDVGADKKNYGPHCAFRFAFFRACCAINSLDRED